MTASGSVVSSHSRLPGRIADSRGRRSNRHPPSLRTEMASANRDRYQSADDRYQIRAEATNQDGGPGSWTGHQLRGDGIPQPVRDELVAQLSPNFLARGNREKAAISKIMPAIFFGIRPCMEPIRRRELVPDIAIMRWEETA